MSTVDNPIAPEAAAADTATPEAAVSEVPVPEAEAQQEALARQIRLGCDIRELSSIVETWDAFLASDCEERFYTGYIAELNTAILPLISTAKDPAVLLSMRELLLGDPARFEKHITRVDEKLRAIDLSQRTYHGIVFDSPEAVALAKEEEKRLEDVMRNLDRNSLESIDAAIAQVNTSPSPIKKLYLDTLHSFRLDLVQRGSTYRGVLYESPAHAEHAKQVYTWAQNIYNSLNRSDETAVKAARDHLAGAGHRATEEFVTQLDKILVDLDIRKRTFRDKVYDTREEVVLLEQEAVRVREILTGMNQASEASMLEAKAALEALTTELKDAPLSTVTNLLREYDIRLRTFNGVLYETREEAITIAQEYQTALAIRQQVDPEDEQSILDAQAALGALTTSVKDDHLQTLKVMWEAYDQKQRTFGNLVFDTREEALLARSTYQEFMTRFNAMDLAQSANLVLLEQYIAESLHEKLRDYATGLVNNVRMVHTRIAYILRTDATINMATQKKESADLYQFIEETIPMMTKYRLRTENMEALKKKHYASLNMGKKFLNFFKK